MSDVLQIITESGSNSLKEVDRGISSLKVFLFDRVDLIQYNMKSSSVCPGVYVLYNEVKNGQGIVYIGETENVQERLLQHEQATAKRFWTKTIVLQDRLGIINKAYCKYIENRLYEVAQKAEKAIVSNVVTPTKSYLSPADTIRAENIIDGFLQICNALNIKLFNIENAGNIPNRMYLQYAGVNVVIQKNNATEYVLLRGSVCRYKEIVDVKYAGYVDKIKQMLKKNKAKQILNTMYYELLEDMIFDTEVEIAAFVLLEDVPFVESLFRCV